jgi:hypothetical protein
MIDEPMGRGAINADEAGAATAGSPVVVKLGGTTIVEQQDILREITEERRRRPVVVVHGGGRRITEWLDRLGVTSRFEAGRRVTDDATLETAAPSGGRAPRGSAASSPSPWPTPRCCSRCWRTAGCPC